MRVIYANDLPEVIVKAFEEYNPIYFLSFAELRHMLRLMDKLTPELELEIFALQFSDEAEYLFTEI